MYKCILFTTNLEKFKKMYNLICLSKNNFCINLIQIATTYEELQELNNKFEFNLIIMCYSDLKNEKIFSIFKKIQNKIIFTDSISNLKNSKNTLYLSFNSFSQYELKKLSNFLTKISEVDIRKYFRTLLKNYEFNFNLNGTTYLLESIVYSYMNKDKYVSENLEKNVFPKVAKIYNTTDKNVKWAIVRSINNIKCTNSKLKQFDDRLTPKSVIIELLSLI